MTVCVCVFTILLSLNSVLSVLRVVLATHQVSHPSAMNINDMLMLSQTDCTSKETLLLGALTPSVAN